MLLHAEDLGEAHEVAVLVHGHLGSAESWWRVVPLLVARGYRVLALDLPGHGRSPRDPGLTVERAADAVAETVEHLAPQGAALAIGHSYGGLVLAAAAARIDPGRAVYVDAAFALAGGLDHAEVTASYERDRRERTVDRLRATRPQYSERDCVVEGVAAERFDAATAASVAAGPGGAWDPAPGSIVVRADPSAFVGDDDVRRLARRGVDVRSIRGAAHSVWYSHFDEFVAVLPEVFERTRGVS
ncbi:hypothetical protein GCM10009809_29930 [Isoptericola hypogeus]|uniref:AB hydrolase-1 domain-containing protein n=1 Tax=Isoptericola hypogeus TaxID=300179 RepID=A0ABN2JML9_9MICO